MLTKHPKKREERSFKGSSASQALFSTTYDNVGSSIYYTLGLTTGYSDTTPAAMLNRGCQREQEQ